MTNPPHSTNRSTVVAHRLRVTRLMLGLTEEQAATEFGVSLRTYRKYEAGHIPSRGRWGEDFCEKYGVEFCWLWFGETCVAPRFKSRIAVLPASTAKLRVSYTTSAIMSLLPKNRRDARAILEWAISLVDMPYMVGESDVVQFPKRPPAEAASRRG